MTPEHMRWLRKIRDYESEEAGSRRYVVPDDVHDLLVDRGYIRWDRGVIVISAAGMRALERG